MGGSPPLGTRDDLASMRPRLQHDGADDLVSAGESGVGVIAARGHDGREDVAVAVCALRLVARHMARASPG
jgi:hypothetical protein